MIGIVERLRHVSRQKGETYRPTIEDEAAAEIERLENERDEWKHGCIARQTDQYRLNAEIERLRAELKLRDADREELAIRRSVRS